MKLGRENKMKNEKNDLFIREVAEQLLPYITKEVTENNEKEVEYVDEDGNTKADLKHIYESNGAEIIDLDLFDLGVLMEEEGRFMW